MQRTRQHRACAVESNGDRDEREVGDEDRQSVPRQAPGVDEADEAENPPMVATKRATSIAAPAARRSGGGRLRSPPTTLRSTTARSPRNPRVPIAPSVASAASVMSTPVDADHPSYVLLTRARGSSRWVSRGSTSWLSLRL